MRTPERLCAAVAVTVCWSGLNKYQRQILSLRQCERHASDVATTRSSEVSRCCIDAVEYTADGSVAGVLRGLPGSTSVTPLPTAPAGRSGDQPLRPARAVARRRYDQRYDVAVGIPKRWLAGIVEHDRQHQRGLHCGDDVIISFRPRYRLAREYCRRSVQTSRRIRPVVLVNIVWKFHWYLKVMPAKTYGQGATAQLKALKGNGRRCRDFAAVILQEQNRRNFRDPHVLGASCGHGLRQGRKAE